MKRFIRLTTFFLMAVVFFGCNHNGNGKLPKVKTGNVIANYFATGRDGVCYVNCDIGGLIEANGAVVVKYGVCYSTTHNKPTMYNDEYPDSDSYELSHAYGTLSGSQVQPVRRSAAVPYSGNKKLYARAYALTADGEEVYGKTVTFDPNEEHEDQLAYLLSRPNGWKLSSTSGSLEWWEPANHTIVFDRNGACYYTGTNYYPSSHNWYANYDYDDIDPFFDGNSEILPECNKLYYKISFFNDEEIPYPNDPYNFPLTIEAVYQAIILNLNKNELKIRRKVNTGNTVELTYVPAP